MRKVYENVEMIREHRGITQTKMAKDAGISMQRMHRMLTGQSELTADVLKSISRTLIINDMNVFFDDKLTESVISSS